jgi:trehalose synthase
MRATLTSDLWWKTAVVYCLDVQTFYDGDGDGMGDFRGLSERVDYLAELGVTCLWLMPFYPTADKDDGYDVTDFYGVDPRLGTGGDFVEFMRVARDRGLRVIADLVVNHTSVHHPWFESARSSRSSPYRDWFVWRDDPPEEPGQVVFPGEQESVWAHDDATDSWYLHHFYRHQPTLNVANPLVRQEISRIVGYWMELGLAGFRVDSVPFILDTVAEARTRADIADLPEPHEFLRNLTGFLSRRRGDAILLGEVNLPPDAAVRYFGSDDELTMVFDFSTMQACHLALARHDAGPLRATLRSRPQPPPTSQWAMFLRNHDELTLDQLSTPERHEVFEAFGPEERMQVFGRGLRRRVPPMLDDPDRVRMAYSLMFSLPGTPTLFYGEEIGMGENLDVPGRMSVRTPMQWDGSPTAGFSPVDDPARLVRPTTGGPFSPQAGVNVAEQRNDAASLLAWVQLLAHRYRDCPELAWGEVVVLDPPAASVLALRADWEDGTVVVAHNLADDAVDLDLPLPNEPPGTVAVDLLGAQRQEPLDGEDRLTFSLKAYGTRWYRIVRPGDRPLL